MATRLKSTAGRLRPEYMPQDLLRLKTTSASKNRSPLNQECATATVLRPHSLQAVYDHMTSLRELDPPQLKLPLEYCPQENWKRAPALFHVRNPSIAALVQEDPRLARRM